MSFDFVRIGNGYIFMSLLYIFYTYLYYVSTYPIGPFTVLQLSGLSPLKTRSEQG